MHIAHSKPKGSYVKCRSISFLLLCAVNLFSTAQADNKFVVASGYVNTQGGTNAYAADGEPDFEAWFQEATATTHAEYRADGSSAISAGPGHHGSATGGGMASNQLLGITPIGVPTTAAQVSVRNDIKADAKGNGQENGSGSSLAYSHADSQLQGNGIDPTGQRFYFLYAALNVEHENNAHSLSYGEAYAKVDNNYVAVISSVQDDVATTPAAFHEGIPSVKVSAAGNTIRGYIATTNDALTEIVADSVINTSVDSFGANERETTAKSRAIVVARNRDEVVSWFPGASASYLPWIPDEGDFNFDGELNAYDIDRLSQESSPGGLSVFEDANPEYDIDLDQTVNYFVSSSGVSSDSDYLIRTLLGTEYGDTDLDGDVDVIDLGVVDNNWGLSNTGWAGGDFDGDGDVDIVDFGILGDNYGFGTAPAVSVPEPQSVVVGASLLLILSCCAKRTS